MLTLTDADIDALIDALLEQINTETRASSDRPLPYDEWKSAQAAHPQWPLWERLIDEKVRRKVEEQARVRA